MKERGLDCECVLIERTETKEIWATTRCLDHRDDVFKSEPVGLSFLLEGEEL